MKTHRQYIEEKIRKSPKFAGELAEADRDVEIAVELAKLRQRRGLSQVQVARLAGMKQPQIARLESGAHLPQWGTLQRLLGVLGGRLELGSDFCRLTTAPKKAVAR
jgi:transcriptional regulator with XRE-family HTH domain